MYSYKMNLKDYIFRKIYKKLNQKIGKILQKKWILLNYTENQAKIIILEVIIWMVLKDYKLQLKHKYNSINLFKQVFIHYLYVPIQRIDL